MKQLKQFEVKVIANDGDCSGENTSEHEDEHLQHVPNVQLLTRTDCEGQHKQQLQTRSSDEHNLKYRLQSQNKSLPESA